jgi:hypothetical protein
VQDYFYYNGELIVAQIKIAIFSFPRSKARKQQFRGGRFAYLFQHEKKAPKNWSRPCATAPCGAKSGFG